MTRLKPLIIGIGWIMLGFATLYLAITNPSHQDVYSLQTLISAGVASILFNLE